MVDDEGKRERKNGISPAGNFAVLTPYDFLTDITLEAHNACCRVWTQAMYMTPGKISASVCDILKSSAKKGIDTRLHTDWFGETLANSASSRESMYTDLEKNNIAITITNKPNLVEHIFPYRGRNHMKLTIIDDTGYIGGINYGDKDFTYNDFMVKVTDTKTVEALADVFEKVETGTLTDTEIVIHPHTSIIVDRGSGNSPILTRVIKEIYGAEEGVQFLNQFVPDGEFLEALHTVYTNGRCVEGMVPRENTFNVLFNTLSQLNLASMELKGQHIPITAIEEMIHAKLVLIDNHIGIIGSHNLTQRGVQMKTAEIAFVSSQHTYIHNLQSYYEGLKKVH